MSVNLVLWLWAPLVASAGFAALAPLAARHVPARTATWLLSAGSALLAAAAVVLPALALVTVLGQWGPLASLGHWSGRFLAIGPPAGQRAWAVGLAVVAVQLPLVATATWRRGLFLLQAWHAARVAPGPLIVVPDERPAAFALPGWPGRIVATRGLLQTLDPAERRVVLAHEQAHLDGRHDLHLAVTALSAAANPLLLSLPGAVRLATERWADEEAATAAGDRRLVARTIARVADCRPEATGPRGAMAITGGEVAARVRALVRPPTGARLPVVVAVAVLALVPALSATVAATQTNAAFQQAERAAVAAPAARADTAHHETGTTP